ncbi:hypothetical protein P171DRAFT_46778 [Karstenula rhodostoma CBS 690.94]|uniref:Uncharacterized protein n=1 Tax=Karstenula rhodostoma CBS 690.94 TaxID=1392251 RepID=A0A9P4PF64_9PLEO|nr:hypothetical protein P171DRAFT_46778 [Karstenula rhodostoma CBS 690.94]
MGRRSGRGGISQFGDLGGKCVKNDSIASCMFNFWCIIYSFSLEYHSSFPAAGAILKSLSKGRSKITEADVQDVDSSCWKTQDSSLRNAFAFKPHLNALLSQTPYLCRWPRMGRACSKAVSPIFFHRPSNPCTSLIGFGTATEQTTYTNPRQMTLRPANTNTSSNCMIRLAMSPK